MLTRFSEAEITSGATGDGLSELGFRPGITALIAKILDQRLGFQNQVGVIPTHLGVSDFGPESVRALFGLFFVTPNFLFVVTTSVGIRSAD